MAKEEPKPKFKVGDQAIYKGRLVRIYSVTTHFPNGEPFSEPIYKTSGGTLRESEIEPMKGNNNNE